MYKKFCVCFLLHWVSSLSEKIDDSFKTHKILIGPNITILII